MRTSSRVSPLLSTFAKAGADSASDAAHAAQAAANQRVDLDIVIPPND
ncbi:hypothetical protein PPH41_39340 [Burkholderia gladioli]|nr:hypothetical protein [Burkholderia gladioli]